jgi:uncharacterized protein YybS (DUF2232 family)
MVTSIKAGGILNSPEVTMSYISLIINFITAIPKLFQLFNMVDKALKKKRLNDADKKYKESEGVDEQKKSFDDLVDKL